VAGGVDLPSIPIERQIDLIEVEKRKLLMRFMDTMVQVYASAGVNQDSMELIKRLRRVYFVGEEEVERAKAEQVARELEEISQKVFFISSPKRKGGPAILEYR
jgi:hypothetical protein